MNAFNYFVVSSGLLSPEHRRRIGIAIWEFAWLIDHQFKPKNGDADTGLVLNGEIVTASRIASDLGLSIRTVQRNLESLEAEKYIRAEEIPGVGKRYFIANPKRWQFSSTHDRSVMGTHDRSVARPTQKCRDPHDRSVMGNKEARLSRLKDSKPSAKNAEVDSRHAPIREAIKAAWLKSNPTMPNSPWAGREAAILARVLKDNPSWTEAQFLTCVRNRFLSELNHSEPPSRWLADLASYAAGPLDKFRHPKVLATAPVRYMTETYDVHAGKERPN